MTSKRENILEDIKTTLEQITVANGYNTDITKVTRQVRPPELSQVDFTDNPQAFVVDRSEVLVEATNRHIEAKISESDGGLLVEIHVLMTSSSSTSINALIEDVKKALYADVSRGGHAIHTKISANEIRFDREYPHNDIVFTCRVLYDYSMLAP